MVNIAAQINGLSFMIKSVTPIRLVSAISTRLYSQFPQDYAKPIYQKEQQAALDENEALRLSHVRFLPAFTNETSSEFHDPEVEKFINYILRDGRKVLAREMLQKAFTNIKRIQLKRYFTAKPENRENIELDPKKIFHMAVSNAKPVMELLKMKRGGLTYHVPVPILEKKQRFFAMNWIIQAAKDKDMKTVHFPESLAKELIDASYNQGRVVKKKQDLHKQCEANRAYAHFRWS